MLKFVRSAVLPVVALGAALGAHAATDTTTFLVQIVITESCDIHTTAATDVDFGTHARSAGVWDAAGNLVVNFSKDTPYTISLNEGLNSTSVTASATNRQMKLGANVVPYGLYRDTGRTLFWGNVVGTNTLAGVGTAANVNVPVFGRVPLASTNVPAGTYVDTVTATITY